MTAQPRVSRFLAESSCARRSGISPIRSMRSKPRGIRSLAIRANRPARGRWTAAPPPLLSTDERGDLIPVGDPSNNDETNKDVGMCLFRFRPRAEDAIALAPSGSRRLRKTRFHGPVFLHAHAIPSDVCRCPQHPTRKDPRRNDPTSNNGRGVEREEREREEPWEPAAPFHPGFCPVKVIRYHNESAPLARSRSRADRSRSFVRHDRVVPRFVARPFRPLRNHDPRQRSILETYLILI
jgi:hypothetical protein